jgi:hypothetical protein
MPCMATSRTSLLLLLWRLNRFIFPSSSHFLINIHQRWFFIDSYYLASLSSSFVGSTSSYLHLFNTFLNVSSRFIFLSFHNLNTVWLSVCLFVCHATPAGVAVAMPYATYVPAAEGSLLRRRIGLTAYLAGPHHYHQRSGAYQVCTFDSARQE